MAQAKHDSITRRALLSGAAAVVPAAAVPAFPPPDFAYAPSGLRAPSEPDPIFAAIAAHARAYADLNAVLDDLAVAEQAAWTAPRGARRAAKKRLTQAYAAERRFGRIEMDAVDRFVATVPQTLAGAAAALAYVRERLEHGCPLCEEDGYRTLIASTEHAICRAAGLPVPDTSFRSASREASR